MASSKLIIPLIHQTFRYGGYINSRLFIENEDVVTLFFTLTINATTKDEEIEESASPAMYPCPPNFELSNWSIVEIPIVHELSK